MESKAINFILEKTIYTGFLDALEFTSSVEDKRYFDYINQSLYRARAYSLDLKPIVDIFLRRRIVEFFIYSMETKKLQADSFCVYRLRSIKKALSSCPEVFAFEYKDFVSSGIEVLKKRFSNDAYLIGCIHSLFRYCNKKDTEDNIFERDIWYLSDYSITIERNASLRFRTLSFEKITDATNRFYVKKYIEYNLCNTDNTVNTIYGKLSSLNFMFHGCTVPYDQWDDNYASSFITKLLINYSDKRTIASRMITYNNFTEYLQLHDYIKKNPLKKYQSLLRIGTFRHTTNSVPDSVENQIFKLLGSIEEEWIILVFLLLYCVGMRVSEACSVTRDCLEKTEKGEFIRYYSLKMKKEVINVIPLALYEKIDSFRSSKTDNSKYLFSAPKDTSLPVQPALFTNKINKLFEENGIVNPDGSPYRFKPHGFRHKMAVKMRRLDIPFEIIQEQLHHSSPEMTLAYVEYIDRDIIRKMDSFIDSSANESNSPFEFPISENKQLAEYMRKSINAQMLPNGICARPVALGKCPNSNSCLSCSEFRTSKAYLNVHRQHLRKVEEYIALAEKEGWLPQVESNKITRDSLIKIICKLEEEG